MDITELKESQIPALQLLAKLGYEILTPAKAFQLRDESTSNVLLESILREQLAKINRIHYRGGEHLFSDANIEEAIRQLKNVQRAGWLKTNEAVYDFITMGTSLTQTIEGNSKSFNLNYIDWKNINNNVFHAVPEYEVRAHLQSSVIPDIVLFVNGIPLCVIECKSPNVEVEEAISQNIRNQGDEYIPKLFAYAQLILAVNRREALYATAGTSKEFWRPWKEKEDKEESIQVLINKPLSSEQKDALFSDDFAPHRNFFDSLDRQEGRLFTEQDKAIYSLCRPERLLDLTYRFIVYDKGEKKIARYQQFFVVRSTLERIKQYDGNRRAGGTVGQAQGSGKSLAMVMLVRALALDEEISNPRILLVTDRKDLDKQLGKTFQACGLSKTRAISGRDLVRHLKEKINIVTTLIHKFDKALQSEQYIDESDNIFVLVDESHRTNFAFLAARMRRMLPNACYVGFTGTPLLKEEKNSFQKFGPPIEPSYSIRDAVKDKAIVPLLYEGRLVDMRQDQAAIDKWFERHTEDLSPEQKADLKRKYARANKLNESDRVIYMRAFDISEHYRKNCQGIGFKAQLAAPSQAAAIKYHKYLKEIGIVSSEVVISSPSTREGHQEVDEGPTEEVGKFWDKMMKRFGSEKEYVENIIEKFKSDDDPEIIIVVDKLLTGFDAPRNTVLYLCRSLKEHTLLQAIARVNRLYEGKDFGYVIDYNSVLEELNKALTMYDAFEGFDEEDIAKALTSVNEEIDKLSQRYSDLHDIFKEVENKGDTEALERLLADDEKRETFYELLTAYSNTLGIALSTDKFLREVSDEDLNRYREDLKNFMKLRQSVQLRYAEKIDFGVYERKIEKLLDAHIQADDVIKLHDPINILDERSVGDVMEESPLYHKSLRSDAAKADAIAHALKKKVNEKMDEDPAFYKKFSELIQKAIDDFMNQKISEIVYLDIITKLEDKVSSKRRDDVPDSIQENKEACAYYGAIKPYFEKCGAADKVAEEAALKTSLAVQKSFREKRVVDFWNKPDVVSLFENEVDDYLSDEIKAEFDLSLESEQIEEMIERIKHIAKSRTPS